MVTADNGNTDLGMSCQFFTADNNSGLNSGCSGFTLVLIIDDSGFSGGGAGTVVFITGGSFLLIEESTSSTFRDGSSFPGTETGTLEDSLFSDLGELNSLSCSHEHNKVIYTEIMISLNFIECFF